MCVLDHERGIVDKIWPAAWQTDTCIGNWHYQRGISYKTPKRIIDLLVDIVSRNGNLLLNLPLPNSGMLDDQELKILEEIRKWMEVNGEAIYATRPWKVFGNEQLRSSGETSDANFSENNRKDLTSDDVRFTTKGDLLYAFVMGWPNQQALITPLAFPGKLDVGKVAKVDLLGYAGTLQWVQDASGLKILLPRQKPCDHAVAFRIAGIDLNAS
jgi:alpha-L-fucosidase